MTVSSGRFLFRAPSSFRRRRRGPFRGSRAFWAALLVSIALSGCVGDAGDVADDAPGDRVLGPPQVEFMLDEAAFDQPPRPSMVAFDVVSADMDQDGDPDLLISWHNLAALELFENDGGSFVRLNPDADDRSGLFENPGISRLYAGEEEMLDKVRRAETAGVFLWHDPSPRDQWNVYVVPEDEPVRLELRANRALQPRLDARFTGSSGEFTRTLVIDTEMHFRVDVELVATQLAAAASLPIFVGLDLSPVGREVSLWKDDPHGIAWVHVRGTPAPELFITRGGLAGALVPPHDPKRDRFFEHVDADLLFEDVSAMIPAGYGRGRRVEWVDVDGDGVNELYIGNTSTPNALLSVGDAGSYEDVAGSLGLDFVEGDTFAWLDVDGNGLDDLVFVDESGFSVARNGGERRFEVVPGSDIGLLFPASSMPGTEGPFTSLSLHVVDFDSDGRLDVWLSGHGEGRGHALYRGTGSAFVDVTAELGLDRAPMTNRIVFFDIENDGYLDAMIFGGSQMWARNRGGGRFDLEEIDPRWRLREFTHAAAADVDGDALVDVVLVGHRRMVARNVTRAAGRAVTVLPRASTGDPVGTLVTAVYTGGMSRAQRFGSALTTRYSQGLGPLHFGIPAGDAIERLVIRWPDGDIEERVVQAREDFIEIFQ